MRKEKLMRKKRFLKPVVLALGGALFMACAVNASAEDITGTGYTEQVNGNIYNGKINGDELTGSPAEIKVRAMVSGLAEIIYNVTITPGSMEFEYSYGSSWEPQNHRYSQGTSSSSTGGWTAESVNGVKNRINVQNNSNFPMTIDFSCTLENKLNNNPTLTGSVIGIFSDNNNAFITNGVVNDSLLNKGLNQGGGSQIGRLDLEMDTSNLEEGTHYYATSFGAACNETTCKGDMYFALAGTPDPNLSGALANYDDVGKITVKVSPFANATLRTK